MKSKSIVAAVACLIACAPPTACKDKSNPADGVPKPAKVVEAGSTDLISVDKPEQFPLVTVEQVDLAGQLQVTGSVNPDIAREVPAISLVSGRVVEIKARLDDYVKKGQLLLKVQSPDITNAYDAYLKSVNDEQLANKAYVRAKRPVTGCSVRSSMPSPSSSPRTCPSSRCSAWKAGSSARWHGRSPSPCSAR